MIPAGGKDKALDVLYFEKANDWIQKYRSNLSREDDGYLCGHETPYEHARKLVMWSYNAKTISQMPDDKQEEANDILIGLMKNAFERRISRLKDG